MFYKRKYGECVDGVCRCAQKCFKFDCFVNYMTYIGVKDLLVMVYKKVTNSDSRKCHCIDCNPDKCRRDETVVDQDFVSEINVVVIHNLKMQNC